MSVSRQPDVLPEWSSSGILHINAIPSNSNDNKKPTPYFSISKTPRTYFPIPTLGPPSRFSPLLHLLPPRDWKCASQDASSCFLESFFLLEVIPKAMSSCASFLQRYVDRLSGPSGIFDRAVEVSLGVFAVDFENEL